MNRGIIVFLSIAAALVIGCGPQAESNGSTIGFREISKPAGKMAGKRNAGSVFGDGGSSLQANEDFAQAGVSNPQAPTMQTVSQTAIPLALQQREVIRKATLEVRVANVEEAERKLNGMIEGSGGFVEGVTSTDLDGPEAKINVVARVPVMRFDQTLAKVEDLGTRLSKSIEAQDVTAQAIDLDARIKTMRVQEDVVRDMLKGSRDLNQILELQNRLTSLRTEIESIQGQRNALRAQTSLSTLTVILHQSKALMPTKKPDEPDWFAQARGEAAEGAMGAVKFVTSIGLWVAFFSPFWLPIAGIAWWISRSRRVGRPTSVETA